MNESREEHVMRAHKEKCSWTQNKMGRAHVKNGIQSMVIFLSGRRVQTKKGKTKAETGRQLETRPEES